jgi:hypothetical protein
MRVVGPLACWLGAAPRFLLPWAQIAPLSGRADWDGIRDDGLGRGVSALRTAGDRTGGEQDKQPIRVAR